MTTPQTPANLYNAANPAASDLSTTFYNDNNALLVAVNNYNIDFAQFKTDQQNYQTEQLAKLKNIGDPFVFLALVLSVFASPVDKPNTNDTVTGLYEDQIKLAGDNISVMAAMTKCENDIETASNTTSPTSTDPMGGTTQGLAQNAFAMDVLLDETQPTTTSKGLSGDNIGILSGINGSAPLDPSAVSSIHSELRTVRIDILNKGDADGDAGGQYNQTIATAGSTTPLLYHLSTLSPNDPGGGDPSGVANSYAQLAVFAQTPGSGNNQQDPSRGATTAQSTMTNAFQVDSQTTQTINSAYNLTANQETNNDQNALAFINQLVTMTATVMKTIVQNENN